MKNLFKLYIKAAHQFKNLVVMAPKLIYTI